MSKAGNLLLKGLWAPVKAIMPKNPWLRVLVYALPILLLLALFGPALEVVLRFVDLVIRVIEPMLQTLMLELQIESECPQHPVSATHRCVHSSLQCPWPDRARAQIDNRVEMIGSYQVIAPKQVGHQPIGH